MKNIVLPQIKDRSLAFYLAMEEFVAREIDDDAVFVWRVAPTVIIGRNQDLEAEVNLDYCRSHGVEIIRRKSGGGCVYSDKGNVMISCVFRRGEVAEVFEKYLAVYHDPMLALQCAEIYCLLKKHDKIKALLKAYQGDSGKNAMLFCYYLDALIAFANQDMAALKELLHTNLQMHVKLSAISAMQ
jgi:hypothetical protein